jgi:hypothetical protein
MGQAATGVERSRTCEMKLIGEAKTGSTTSVSFTKKESTTAPSSLRKARCESGKFCNVGGKLVPFDEPLREVGGDWCRQRTPQPNTERQHLRCLRHPFHRQQHHPHRQHNFHKINAHSLPQPGRARVGVCPEGGWGEKPKARALPSGRRFPRRKPAALTVSTGRRGFVPLL